MRCYLDTSAAAKLLVQESESDALTAFLERAVEGGDAVGSSRLLETELRRLALRIAIPQEHVTLVLERLDLLVPDDEVFRTAGLLPGTALRSLDALHVAAALRWGADAVATYDERQALAARAVGLEVVAPA
jgi:predicted nucleic acid-binding protein